MTVHFHPGGVQGTAELVWHIFCKKHQSVSKEDCEVCKAVAKANYQLGQALEHLKDASAEIAVLTSHYQDRLIVVATRPDST